MNVVAAFEGSPSGTLAVEIINPYTGGVLLARTTSGIVNVTGTDVYVWSGAIPDAAAYLPIWDAGGGVFWADDVQQPPAVIAAPSAPGSSGGLFPAFTIKRNDTLPLINVIAALDNGQVVNVSGAQVFFNMRPAADQQSGFQGAPKVHKTASVIDGPNGLMRYLWATDGSDTNETGNWDAEFEVRFQSGANSGRIETFPTSGYIAINIVADLDPGL